MRNVLLGIALLWHLLAAAGETVLIAAEDSWFPYTGRIEGHARGMSVDIIREAFAAEGITTRFELVPYARCVTMTKAGEFVACFNTSRTAETEHEFLWPNVPLFQALINIYAHRDSALHVASVRQLEGRRVAVTRGYEYSSEFDTNQKIIKDQVNTDLGGFRMLLAGRVEFTVAFDKVANHLLGLHESEFKGNIRAVGNLAQNDIYLSFSKTHRDAPRLLEAFNKGFATIRRNGRYREIEKRWK